MSASLPVRSLLAATAAMLLLSACSTAYYTGDTISGPAQRMKRDADGNLHDPLLDAPNRSLMTCTSEAPVTVLDWFMTMPQMKKVPKSLRRAGRIRRACGPER